MVNEEIFNYAHDNKTIDVLTRTKVRFTRGQFWMFFLKDILMFGVGMWAFLQMMQGTIVYDILINYKWQLYIIGPLVYIFGGYIAGYIDEHYGLWKAENAYGTVVLNPEGMKWQAEFIKKTIKEE